MAKGEFRKQLRKTSKEKDSLESLTSYNDNKYYNPTLKSPYTGSVKRGDIFFFDKGFNIGSEQHGGRPGIIVSNNACNSSSDCLLVVYLTTKPKEFTVTHVPLHSTIPISSQLSIALCEQIHSLSKIKIQSYFGKATDEEMKEINKALILTLGMDLAYISPKEYEELTNRIKELKQENEALKMSISNSNVTIENYEELLEIKKQLTEASIQRDTYKNLYEDILKKYLKEI